MLAGSGDVEKRSGVYRRDARSWTLRSTRSVQTKPRAHANHRDYRDAGRVSRPGKLLQEKHRSASMLCRPGSDQIWLSWTGVVEVGPPMAGMDPTRVGPRCSTVDPGDDVSPMSEQFGRVCPDASATESMVTVAFGCFAATCAALAGGDLWTLNSFGSTPTFAHRVGRGVRGRILDLPIRFTHSRSVSRGPAIVATRSPSTRMSSLARALRPPQQARQRSHWLAAGWPEMHRAASSRARAPRDLVGRPGGTRSPSSIGAARVRAPQARLCSMCECLHVPRHIHTHIQPETETETIGRCSPCADALGRRPLPPLGA